jgi:hypothetical protein
MFRPVTNITFQQKPSDQFPNRNKSLLFDFVCEFECSDSWEDLTNKGKITVPKNIFVRDETGKLVGLGGINKNIGGFGANDPLFLRNDKVTIEAGYRYRNNLGNEVIETNILFDGYISKVGSKKPIELEIEDNMFILKQTPVPYSKIYTGTLEQMLKEMLQGTPFTVNTLTTTNIGRVQISNKETVAQVLARLKRDYFMHSYFRGNELRCGSLVYIESEAKTDVFAFQQNIIEDELEYQRKDDITLSAIARNTIETENGITRDGKTKFKKQRLEIVLTLKNNKTTYQVIEKGHKADPSVEGERRDFHFTQATSISQLVQLAKEQLERYYYTGLNGKFTTFGLPFIRQGDNAIIRDSVLPERNGTYKIKKVDYKGGVDGLRQIPHLDFKIK